MKLFWFDVFRAGGKTHKERDIFTVSVKSEVMTD